MEVEIGWRKGGREEGRDRERREREREGRTCS